MLKRLDRSVLSGSWKAIVIACSGFVLDYFLNLALSQWLTPADLGDYSVAVSIAAFGGLFILFGTDQAMMQFLPSYIKDNDWQRIKGMLIFAFSLILIPGMTISFASLVYLVFSDSFFTNHHPAILALVCLPIVGLTLLITKTLRAFGHIVMASAPISIFLPLFIMTGGYLLTREHDTTDFALTGLFCASFVLVFAIQFITLMRHVGPRLKDIAPVYQNHDWGKVAVSLMMASLLFLAMEQVGLYACEILANEEDVALYAVIIKHARFLLIIYMAVNLSVIPFISPALKNNDRETLQGLYGTSMHIVLWGGLIPLLVFVFKGEAILEAFGPEYKVGYTSLLILMGAYYLNFVAGFSVPFLQFSGHRKVVVWSIGIALCLEIILFGILVPLYGFSGAVWSMAATLSVLSIWLTYQCCRRLNLRPLKLS